MSTSTTSPGSRKLTDSRYTTVLFDLDGTLLDTAADLAAALNAVIVASGAKALPFELIRPVVSHGGNALIELGFGIKPGEPDFEPLRQQFLEYYANNIARQTSLFPGMAALLGEIEQRGLRWGIVTNKPTWLTEPLLRALHLQQRVAVVVCGDTIAQRKPHPAPLLHACRQIRALPRECLYIGDAERDIRAGRDAGMTTLVALFGYLLEDDRPETWGASAMIREPGEVLAWLS